MRYYYAIIGLMFFNIITITYTWAEQTVQDPEYERACTLALIGLFVISLGWEISAIVYNLNSKEATILALVITLLIQYLLHRERQEANQPPPEEEIKRYFLPPKE